MTRRSPHSKRLAAAALACSFVAACSVPGPEGSSSSGSAKGSVGSHYYVTVSKPANGTIVSADGRVRCGAEGSACGDANGQTRFDWATVAVFDAIPAQGYRFSGWAGDCTGLGQCRISTADKAADSLIVAVFEPEAAYRGVYFMVTVARPIGGTIRSVDEGINCGTPGSLADRCDFKLYRWTETATLLAIPEPGFRVKSWGGDCAPFGSALVCKLDTAVFATDKQVSVTFEPGEGSSVLVWDTGSWDTVAWQ